MVDTPSPVPRRTSAPETLPDREPGTEFRPLRGGVSRIMMTSISAWTRSIGSAAKTLAKSLFSRAEGTYRRYLLHRAIGRKLRPLKRSGRFRTYPKSEPPPIVSGYPFYRRKDNRWFDFFYSVYRRPSREFIPLTTYYQIIEPLLNRYALLQAVADKNAYDERFPDVSTPPTPLRRIHGQFYDGEYGRVLLDDEWIRARLNPLGRVLIKPSLDSGSGRNIVRFDTDGSVLRTDGRTLDEVFLREYPDDFVLQEVVEQHGFFAQFNPTCNNTLRVFTYRSVLDEEVHVLHTLLRVGKTGSYVDHDNLGGVAIAITEDFKLKEHAIDGGGSRLRAFNGVEFCRIGAVPRVAEARRAAVAMASRVHHGRLLAFDFTVNHEGVPILLDINCYGNGVSQYQLNNGSLFNEFTVEVLDYCKENLDRMRWKT